MTLNWIIPRSVSTSWKVCCWWMVYKPAFEGFYFRLVDKIRKVRKYMVYEFQKKRNLK